MARYLIIGGTGSLGKKLIDRLLTKGNAVAVYSRDEAKHWTIRNELGSSRLANRSREGLNFFVGDIRDRRRLQDTIRQYKPNKIIIAAALKQVDTCELAPDESIQTNLIGTQNVIDAVNDLAPIDLQEVLFVSTDKACSPVNVYGMCKAVSERTVTSQARTGLSHVKYMCVRYGNVLESRGSIIPLFRYQAQYGDAITVTNPDMTRFVMTLDDSVNLINHALTCGNSGETWIPMLPAMRIGDLAELFAERYDKSIKIIGLRPGEKAHEDLINESESVRTSKLDSHYVIKPAYETGNGTAFSYTSAHTVMTKNELATHLVSLGILDWDLSKFQGRSIEELRTL